MTLDNSNASSWPSAEIGYPKANGRSRCVAEVQAGNVGDSDRTTGLENSPGRTAVMENNSMRRLMAGWVSSTNFRITVIRLDSYNPGDCRFRPGAVREKPL